MKVTRQELRNHRRPDCAWTEEALDAAIEARFPNQDPIDFHALLMAWHDDTRLDHAAIRQAALLGAEVTTAKGGNRPLAILVYPRQALLNMAAQFPPEAPPADE